MLTFINSIVEFLAIPATIMFLFVGLLLTIKTKFVQFRAFNKFLAIIKSGPKHDSPSNAKTINPIHALFTALSTTLGMGNIMGPSIAIVTGGPGALFWLTMYAFLGAVLKFTEVSFALHTRKITDDGKIIGGPTEYLKSVSPFFAIWYGAIMIFLFAGWSGIQANALAGIFALEGIPAWISGLSLATLTIIVLRGGAQRVGYVASKLVPIMCFLYLTFAFFILCKDFSILATAFRLIGENIFTPTAALGGFAGATVLQAIRAGVYKSIFITESGIGTSSIPHSVADVQKPTDQGIIAMYSIAADAFLSFISGLLVLTTGIWITSGFSNTIMYEVFTHHSPTLGKWILLISITLFILTTVIGNSFNGVQSFASFTRHRYVMLYQIFTFIAILMGALVATPLIWGITDILITLVAIPNLIGLVILSFSKPEVLRFK